MRSRAGPARFTGSIGTSDAAPAIVGTAVATAAAAVPVRNERRDWDIGGVPYGTCQVRSQRWARRALIRSAPSGGASLAAMFDSTCASERMPGMVVDTALW